MNELTVKELIEELKKLPQDLPIMLSSDDEGNDYRELYCTPTLATVDDDGYVSFADMVYDNNIQNYVDVDVDESNANVVILG